MASETKVPSTVGEYLDNWMTEVSAKIARLPEAGQAELRSEFNAISARALAALGNAHGAELAKSPPHTALYQASMREGELSFAGGKTELTPDAAQSLTKALTANAEAAGLDGEKIGERLARGAANAHEERDWIKADVHAVAAKKGLNMDDKDQRAEAAGTVDRFYEKATELLAQARGVRVEWSGDRLRNTLTSMAEIEQAHGRVPFDTAESARTLSKDMQERYGENIVKDLAAGKTDALETDFADPATRQKIAKAVVAAAVEHEEIGLSPDEARAAQERLREQEKPERTRERDRDDAFEL